MRLNWTTQISHQSTLLHFHSLTTRDSNIEIDVRVWSTISIMSSPLNNYSLINYYNFFVLLQFKNVLSSYYSHPDTISVLVIKSVLMIIKQIIQLLNHPFHSNIYYKIYHWYQLLSSSSSSTYTVINFICSSLPPPPLPMPPHPPFRMLCTSSVIIYILLRTI